MLVGLTKAVVVYTTKSEYYDPGGGRGEQSSQAGGGCWGNQMLLHIQIYVDHG